MPLTMQAKLLRVLEEGEVERIGSSKPTPVDVRILVATHRDLEALVREGKFRQDLFHRVHVFPILCRRCATAQKIYRAHRALRATGVCAEWLEAGPVYPGCGCAAAGAMRGPEISASCATWSSACSCSPTEQVDRELVDLALPAHGPLLTQFAQTDRPALRSGLRLRERDDPCRTRTQPSPYYEHREGAWPGAQLSLQEVPAARHRSAQNSTRRRSLVSLPCRAFSSRSSRTRPHNLLGQYRQNALESSHPQSALAPGSRRTTLCVSANQPSSYLPRF